METNWPCSFNENENLHMISRDSGIDSEDLANAMSDQNVWYKIVHSILMMTGLLSHPWPKVTPTSLKLYLKHLSPPAPQSQWRICPWATGNLRYQSLNNRCPEVFCESPTASRALFDACERYFENVSRHLHSTFPHISGYWTTSCIQGGGRTARGESWERLRKNRYTFQFFALYQIL